MALNRIGKSYDYRAICDVCGFKKWSYELRKRWDGLMVCQEDWEPRNILDFYRTRNDAHRLPWTRPDAQEVATETSLSGFALSLSPYQTAQSASIPYIVTTYPVTQQAMILLRKYNQGVIINFGRYISGHLMFRFEINGNLSFYFANPITTFRNFNSSSITNLSTGPLPLNTWIRLSVVILSDTSASFYASFKNTNGIVTHLIDNSPNTVSVGSYVAGPSPFNVGGVEFPADAVDDIRIWNVARTQTQIQTYWNTVVPSTTMGLVMNYRFDEGFVHNNPSPITVDSVAPGVRDMTLYGSSYFPHLMNYSNSGV